MIGKNVLEINMQDLALRGMSTSSNMTDGAFSPETDAVNLSVQGTLHHPATPVDSDTNNRLTGNIIASSPDMSLIGADNRLVVADNDTYYRYNGTNIIAAAYSGGTASTTAAGFTDIITYRGEAYVSCKERIKRWTSTNVITDLGSFASTGFATVPHPMLVYENNFYAADGNFLLQATAVNTMPTVILTLDVNQTIMALGIDPGSGLMLISTITTFDTSGTLPTTSRLLWYDGNSVKVAKSVITEDTIFGFHTNSGVTYVGYGKNLGYINGSGISFLRKLSNVTNVQAELPYKHHFASIGKNMYVLDGLQVLQYGEVVQGRKVFSYCYKNNINSNKPTAIFAGGGSKLGICFSASGPTYEFYTIDTTSVANSNSITFYTNKYRFPRPVFIRSGYIEYSDALANNDNNRNIYYMSEDEITGFQILGLQGGTNLKNETGASVTFQDDIIGFIDPKMRSIQFRYIADTTNTGVKRIVFLYDVAE